MFQFQNNQGFYVPALHYGRWFLLLVISCVIAYQAFLPHFLATKYTKEAGLIYNPYSLIEFYDMTNVTGPRIKESLEGKLIVSDTDLYEYKNSASFLPPFATLVYHPFKYITQSVTKVVILTDILFIFVYVWLFFILFYILSGKNFWISLFFSAFTSLYPFWAIHIPPANLGVVDTILNSVFPFMDNPTAHPLARRESFIPGLLPFLLHIIFLLLTVTKQKWSYAIAAGFFLALNAYTYPYHFLYLSASVGVLFILMASSKRWTIVKQLFVLGVSSLVFLIPFIVNQIQLRLLPQYDDIIGRFGVEIGRSFRLDFWERYLILIAVGCALWYFGKKKGDQIRSVFAISFLVGALLVLNMNVLLGYTVQSDHWLNRDIVWGMTICYFLLFSWFFDYINKKYFKISRIISMALAALLLSTTLTVVKYHEVTVGEKYDRYTIAEERLDLFDWLNTNTPAESVILSASLGTNYFIPLYTHNNIFVPRGLNTLASDDEIMSRFIISYKLLGLNEERFKRTLSSDIDEERQSRDSLLGLEDHGVMYLYSVKYAPRELGTYIESDSNFFTLPESEYNSFFESFLNYNCVGVCLGGYKADYVVAGPFEYSAGVNLENEGWLENVYSNSSYTVFKIKNENEFQES